MGLFKPAWMKKDVRYQQDKKKIKKSIDKVRSQEELAVIVKTAPDYHAYSYAINKLTDQAILEDIVKNDSRSIVRGLATYKLTDQSILEHLALGDADWGVREAAVKKLSDQTILGTIAKTDSSDAVRYYAIERLTDQTALEYVARNEIMTTLRQDALKKIVDENLRREIEYSPRSEEQKEQDRIVAMNHARFSAQAKKSEQASQWRKEGRCPHCGMQLTGWDKYEPRTKLKDDRTHTYTCGACGRAL